MELKLGVDLNEIECITPTNIAFKLYFVTLYIQYLYMCDCPINPAISAYSRNNKNLNKFCILCI